VHLPKFDHQCPLKIVILCDYKEIPGSATELDYSWIVGGTNLNCFVFATSLSIFIFDISAAITLWVRLSTYRLWLMHKHLDFFLEKSTQFNHLLMFFSPSRLTFTNRTSFTPKPPLDFGWQTFLWFSQLIFPRPPVVHPPNKFPFSNSLVFNYYYYKNDNLTQKIWHINDTIHIFYWILLLLNTSFFSLLFSLSLSLSLTVAVTTISFLFNCLPSKLRP